jgi:ubiquitin-protein ligase
MAETKAQKKLLKELQKMHEMLASPEADSMGIAALPVDDNNLLKWKAVIAGPVDSEFDGAWFPLTFEFTTSYPHKPPKVRFDCDMHHPNIYTTRNICLDILSDKWSPAMQITSVLVSIRSLLVDPNISSPANCDASRDFRENRERYAKAVRDSIKKQSLQSPPLWYTAARTNAASTTASTSSASTSNASTSTK